MERDKEIQAIENRKLVEQRNKYIKDVQVKMQNVELQRKMQIENKRQEKDYKIHIISEEKQAVQII